MVLARHRFWAGVLAVMVGAMGLPAVGQGTQTAPAQQGVPDAPTPQTLLALRVREKPEIEMLKRTSAEIARASKGLTGRGRVFVRYSGTEPVLRVLVEGPSRAENVKTAGAIAKIYLTETGQSEEAHL